MAEISEKDIIDLHHILTSMRLGMTYRIIWARLADVVWLQSTCDGQEWTDERLLKAHTLDRFLNMVKYAGFYVRIHTNGAGAKTYSIL